jgi:hypothetical protein
MKVTRVNEAVINLEPENTNDNRIRENDLLSIKNLMEAYFRLTAKERKDEILTAEQISSGIFWKFGFRIPYYTIQEVIDSM